MTEWGQELTFSNSQTGHLGGSYTQRSALRPYDEEDLVPVGTSPILREEQMWGLRGRLNARRKAWVIRIRQRTKKGDVTDESVALDCHFGRCFPMGERHDLLLLAGDTRPGNAKGHPKKSGYLAPRPGIDPGHCGRRSNIDGKSEIGL